MKIKGKLYEIDPTLVETATRKQKGAKSKKGNPAQPFQSPAVRKLLSQLQQITSDVLFDEREAEAQWPAKRNQIAQDQANKRQANDEQASRADAKENGEEEMIIQATAPHSDHTELTSYPVDADEEADILGGMFSALPDDSVSNQGESTTAVPENIRLRDFGKSSGLTPRRLLEEAVRSRFVIRNHLPRHTHISKGFQCTRFIQDDLAYHLLLPSLADNIMVQKSGDRV